MDVILNVNFALSTEAVVWRCSKKFCKIQWKTPAPESLFNKVVKLRAATLLKKGLWHRCFTVNFAKFLRTPLVAAFFSSNNKDELRETCIII